MLRHLNRLEEYLAVAILVAMSLLVFSQVVLRFVFGLGFGWIDELARIAFIWVVFLGAVVGVQRHLHIRVTLFIRLLPERYRDWAGAFGDLVMLLFCIAIAWHGLELVLSTLEFSFFLPSTGLSMFWPYLILPVSFALQVVRLVLRYVLRDRRVYHV
jgi:C4-dicarboxylate transporter DctQ subunit